LTQKECQVLVNYPGFEKAFVRVELNNSNIYENEAKIEGEAQCKEEWFFQERKNELKYIGY